MEQELPVNGRVQSLSQYCYRALLMNIDACEGFGDIDFDLYEPLLWECSAETLLKFEKGTTDLAERTQPVWEELVKKDHTLEYYRVEAGEIEAPDCWRTFYWAHEEDRRIRLAAAQERIRGSRQEIEAHKRERSTQFVEPVMKRARLVSFKPKSLFAKARFESAKIQRTVYGPGMTSKLASKPIQRTPPSLVNSTSPVKPSTPGFRTSTTEPISFSNPAQLKGLNTAVAKAIQQSPSNGNTLTVIASGKAPASQPTKAPVYSRSSSVTGSPQSSLSSPSMSPPSMSPPPSYPPKKDPLAMIFMPKHKAYSQKPQPAPQRQSTAVATGIARGPPPRRR